MPLPGSRVIPAGWAAAHQGPADGSKTGLISFRVPGGTKGPFDEESGTWETVPNPPYAHWVPCRIQALTNDARHVEAAGDQVTVTGYLITVPADTPGLNIGHLGDLTNTGDALLDGCTVRVDDIVRGSLLFERVLYCSLTD